MGFNQDLAAGEKAERKAIPLIKKQYGKRKVEVWRNPAGKLEGQLKAKRRGDIFDSFGIRWEVKWDRLVEKYGNVFVETDAMFHSEADYVIYFLGEDLAKAPAYMMSRDLLLVEIEKNRETKKFKIVPKGMRNSGGMGAEGTCFTAEYIKKIGKKLT